MHLISAWLYFCLSLFLHHYTDTYDLFCRLKGILSQLYHSHDPKLKKDLQDGPEQGQAGLCPDVQGETAEEEELKGEGMESAIDCNICVLPKFMLKANPQVIILGGEVWGR